jgi:shikimate O-hydroxycinnamoyltransferase
MPSMPLATGDYLFVGNSSCPVTFAFSYSTKLDEKQLQHALDLLLEYFPIVSGSLHQDSETSYVFDTARRRRVVLEVVTTSATFAEIADADPSSLVRFVRSSDGEPLISVRLTHTASGSVLGVSMSHALVDGFSYFHLLSNWASCMRAERPDNTRFERSPLGITARVAQSTSRQSLLTQSGLFWGERRADVISVEEHARVRFTQAEITALVAEAQHDVTVRLRPNDVLTAWLWQRYGVRWWANDLDSPVYMSCPVDIRRALGATEQPLFACAICFATAEASFDALRSAPLGELARRIQASVADVHEGAYETRLATLAAMREQHGLAALEQVHLRHPRRGMLVTNMSRLPLVGLDFGFGPPSDFKFFTQVSSMAAILPASDGVDIRIFAPDESAKP